MENIPTARKGTGPASLTTLALLIAGGVASPAYLNVERTLDRARAMLTSDRAPIAALRGLETRLRVHAEQMFADHTRDVATRLPSGMTVAVRAWDSDIARVTYRLLLTYRQQAEERIAELRARAS